MIDPIERSFDSFDRRQAGRLGAFDHDHLDAELPCRLDLRVGRFTAAVLGDDHLNMMPAQRLQLVPQPERPPAMDIADIGNRQRRLDRIDAANPIVMMRSGIGVVRLLPAGGQEHPRGCCAERGDGLRDAMYGKPMIALHRRPGRSPQGKGRNTVLSRGLHRIGRDAGSERMGRVDHQINRFVLEITDKPLRAAEAAAAHRDRLRGRIGSSASQRQNHIEIGARGERRRQRAGLRRAAQDQNAGLAHG